MKLIKEINEEVEMIVEGSGANKQYFLEGVFLQGNIKNRNQRMYPIDILRNEVARYTDEYIDKGRAVGELGHPSGPSINLERVSHKILSLAQEHNNFIGRAAILDTPYGQIVKKLMEGDVKLGVSSRGLGTIEEKNGCSVVGNDFMLATAADIVADPSAPDAFVKGIMESQDWVYIEGTGWTSQMAEQAKKRIQKTSSRKLEEQKLVEFNKFLRSL